jgi:uncharacterized protein with GYD domain
MPMPKYLFEVSYTTEGAKGLLKEGGSKRRAAVEKTLSGLGAKVEAFYYALGKYDAYLIVDAPDNVSVAAISLAVSAAVEEKIKTTVLMTTQEIDAAAKKTVDYRPPGK